MCEPVETLLKSTLSVADKLEGLIRVDKNLHLMTKCLDSRKCNSVSTSWSTSARTSVLVCTCGVDPLYQNPVFYILPHPFIRLNDLWPTCPSINQSRPLLHSISIAEHLSKMRSNYVLLLWFVQYCIYFYVRYEGGPYKPCFINFILINALFRSALVFSW